MKATLGILVSVVLGVLAGTGAAFIRDADAGRQYERMMQSSKAASTKLTSSVSSVTPALTHDSDEPRIEVEGGDTFEFGVMDRGETRSHAFTVHNYTDQPLHLKVVSTTCKCTVGELGDETIEPGASGEVVLEWVAKSYDTHFEQTATIDTGNPVRSKLLLSVSGKVLQLVQPYPLGIFMNDVPHGEEREETIEIYNFQDGQPLEVLSHDFDDETTAHLYEFSWQPMALDELQDAPEGATSAVSCTLRMLPGVPYGNITQAIRITTDAERSAVVELPITGKIVSDLLVAGSGYVADKDIVKLGMVSADEGREHTLRIVARRADIHPVKIASVVCDPSDVLQAEVGEPTLLKGGSVLMFPLKIIVPPGAREVSFNGGRDKPRATIQIHTTHPVVKQLDLDVRFYVAGS